MQEIAKRAIFIKAVENFVHLVKGEGQTTSAGEYITRLENTIKYRFVGRHKTMYAEHESQMPSHVKMVITSAISFISITNDKEGRTQYLTTFLILGTFTDYLTNERHKYHCQFTVKRIIPYTGVNNHLKFQTELSTVQDSCRHFE